jgi:hypothetical protein
MYQSGSRSIYIAVHICLTRLFASIRRPSSLPEPFSLKGIVKIARSLIMIVSDYERNISYEEAKIPHSS